MTGGFGSFNVEHQLDEMADKFGKKQPLRNIQVKVSGKTGTALPWGEWGTVRTNGDGEFTLSKNSPAPTAISRSR